MSENNSHERDDCSCVEDVVDGVDFGPDCYEHDIDYIYGRHGKVWADLLMLQRTLTKAVTAKSEKAARAAVRRHLLLMVIGWPAYWYHAIERKWKR